MPKIIHIQVLPLKSGVQKISYDILKSMDNTWEKILICGKISESEDVNFLNWFENIGVRVIQIDEMKREISFQDISLLKKLLKILKVEKPDIVHTHSTKSGIVGRIAARLSSVPYIVHTVHGVAFHNSIPVHMRAVFFIIEMLSMPFGNKTVLVNNYYKKYYKYYPFERVETVYNGIDCSLTEYYSKKIEKKFELSILFLARLDAPKDPMTLLVAFKLLKKMLAYDNLGYDAKLKIGGDGELLTLCKSYVRENNLQDSVLFLGWVDETSVLYQDADIFCQPSIYEAFGLSIAQASLYYLPVVSTCVEGIPEVVKHNNSGLLVSPKDPEQLAMALLTLVKNSSLRESFGNNGHAHIVANYSIQKMCNSYQTIYNEGVR